MLSNVVIFSYSHRLNMGHVIRNISVTILRCQKIYIEDVSHCWMGFPILDILTQYKALYADPKYSLSLFFSFSLH